MRRNCLMGLLVVLTTLWSFGQAHFPPQGGTPAATTTTTGTITLAGDLGGAAASPTVLAMTSSGTSFTAGTGANGWVSGKYLYVDGSSIVASATAAGAATVTVSGTSGQVAYFNNTASVTSDSGNFTWDATNDRLGLATSSMNSASILSIQASTSTTANYQGIYIASAMTSADYFRGILVNNTANSSGANAFIGLRTTHVSAPCDIRFDSDGGGAAYKFGRNASQRLSMSNATDSVFFVEPTGEVKIRGSYDTDASNDGDNSGQPLCVQNGTSGVGLMVWQTVHTNGATAPIYIVAENASGTESNVSIEARSVLGANSEMVFRTAAATASGTGTEAMRIDNLQNLQLGPAGAAAADATAGFPFIRTTTASPTGVPTAITGFAPLIYDSSTNIPWIYSGGSWKRPVASLVTGTVTWQ